MRAELRATKALLGRTRQPPAIFKRDSTCGWTYLHGQLTASCPILGRRVPDVRGHDNVDFEPHHIGCGLRNPFRRPAPPAPLYGDVLAFDVAEVPQPLQEDIRGAQASR